MSISSYGPRAQRYAAGLANVSVIVAEAANVLEAYVEAVRRREAGEAFYLLLLLDERHDQTITALAPEVLRETADPDRRRMIFNSVGAGGVTVNGRRSADVLADADITDEMTRLVAGELLALAPALLVRSVLEYERVSKYFGRTRPYELVLVEPSVPAVQRRRAERPGVVLWAPERTGAGVSMHAVALGEIHGSVTIVCSDGAAPAGTTATVLAPADARVLEALATASAVVFADGGDPGAAVAFARRGYGIVAPASSGTHEFVRGAYRYDPAMIRQMHVAVTMALGTPASLRALPPPPPRTPAAPSISVRASEVRPATVIVPTFNRRADLERCLGCIGAQTYPNVRAIVVNDAGEAVDDIVARFPFARLVNLEQNGGAIRACNAGLKLVDDGFVQFLADDDWLYPDHVERLVTAMLVSGAPVAHSNVLIRYMERLPDGALLTTGYNASVFVETATPSEAMVCTPIAGHALMWRLNIFDEIGVWREDSDLADQEIQLRALQQCTFVYVDQITCEWRIHGANFSGKADAAKEQRRIYEVLHPVTDRPLVMQARSATLANIEARPPGAIFPPTVNLSRPPDRA